MEHCAEKEQRQQQLTYGKLKCYVHPDLFYMYLPWAIRYKPAGPGTSLNSCRNGSQVLQAPLLHGVTHPSCPDPGGFSYRLWL